MIEIDLLLLLLFFVSHCKVWRCCFNSNSNWCLHSSTQIILYFFCSWIHAFCWLYNLNRHSRGANKNISISKNAHHTRNICSLSFDRLTRFSHHHMYSQFFQYKTKQRKLKWCVNKYRYKIHSAHKYRVCSSPYVATIRRYETQNKATKLKSMSMPMLIVVVTIRIRSIFSV